MLTLLPALLVAAALLVAVPNRRGAAVARLAACTPPGRVPGEQLGRLAALGETRSPPRLGVTSTALGPVGRRRLAAGTAGLAAALVIGLPMGLAVGAALAVFADRGLSRLEPAAQRRLREELVAQLPVALDLLAACLQGGCPVEDALDAVAAATGHGLGESLSTVVAARRMGATPAQAWQQAGGKPELAALARAVVRAGEGGSDLAESVSVLAIDARDRARAHGEEAARRAGVLAVAPLGLCFLPAFILVGVVPVVVGVAGEVLG